MEPKTHLPVLDGTRACSILLVIAAHTLPLGPSGWALNAMSGKLGMSLFFCLSGFLITRILWDNSSLKPFLIKRLFRIIPAVWLYLVILYLVLGISPDVLLTNALFMSNYWTFALDEGPTSHLWSLCVEVHFYLAVGLAVGIFGRRALWALPFAALVITGLRIEAGAYSNIATHLRADEIMSGGCLALLYIHARDKIQARLRAPALVMIVFAGVTVLWLLSGHKAGGALNYARPYLAATLVGIALFGRPVLITPILESRPMRWIAEISYALYIYHPLMIFGVMNSGSTLERYLIKRPISYVLTIAAALISTHLWEKRWQRFARSLL